ncbi:MAG: ACP S-malonyltransferase [Pseudomonadota bacterium]|nr:ACP S-malonyltransferase [Pseudomonadota bacterium]
MKKRALVIAPGRGTYNKPELGYFARHHADKKHLMDEIDTYRETQGQSPISALDSAEVYSIKNHTRGDNASPLIYGCAYADFLSINRDKYDIACVTGNSMGWYIALACAGALPFAGALHLINTMGTLMQDALIGGQMIYPFINDNWEVQEDQKQHLLSLIKDINARPEHDLYISIMLGGMMVFGGNAAALQALKDTLPPLQDRFPLILPNHASFHTPLQRPISEKAFDIFDASMFDNPYTPLIDGRGHAWRPYATVDEEIFNYTLGHQVYDYYDFTRAVQVSIKEYAPDNIIILGPGTTLGGAVAQCLIDIGWQGMHNKADFQTRQKDDPYIITMGMDEQRALVV